MKISSMEVLSEAIRVLEGHSQNSKLEEVRVFLSRKLKDLSWEAYEDRGTIYYYLLRTYLQGDAHIENAIWVEYYNKMVKNFQKQLQKYKEEIKRDKARSMEHKIHAMQLKAFYNLVEQYFSTLEILYGKKDFHDSRQKAYLEKMSYRKKYYWFRRRYLSFFGYAFIDLTSGFGTSFTRWTITTFFFIFVFGIIFLLVDLGQTQGAMLNGLPLYNYFYFSTVAFTTVGFGDITPLTALEKILSCMEALMGYLMLGMLINLMSKKMK